MTDSRKYTFVTVAFQGEIGLLRLQARSLRLYCPADLVDEIIVVDNARSKTPSRWLAGLLPQYGPLADAVRIIPAAKLVSMPPAAGGWWTQQVLKIQVAEVVRSERYVLLDAKNHLIEKLGRDFLQTAAGLPRICGQSYIGHEMLDFLKRTLSYVGIDPAPHLDWFTSTGTPFTILTSQARDLIRYMEDREKRQFALTLLEKELTEFFLYAGFLESKGVLRSSYDMTQPRCAQIWGHTANEAGCTAAIRVAEKGDRPFLSVHRKAIENLDEKGRERLAEFWHLRGLFTSAADALRFLRDPNRSHQDFSGRIISWPMSRLVSLLS